MTVPIIEKCITYGHEYHSPHERKWHLLFPEGTNRVSFDTHDIPEWLDAYTEEIEQAKEKHQ